MVTQPKTFLVLPYPGFGHIIPMLELSRKIAASGHRVGFAVSENLLDDMRHRKIYNASEGENISFLGLKDGVRHPTAESLSIEIFDELHDKLNASLGSFLASLNVGSQPPNLGGTTDSLYADILIMDMNLGAVPFLVAHRRKIPTIAFVPFAAHTLLQMLQINEDTPAASNEDLLKEMKPGTIIESWKKQLLETQQGLLLADRVLINSFAALEPTFDSDVESLCPKFRGLKYGFIGPILPSKESHRRNCEDASRVANWLDHQKQRSVIYISFGSVANVKIEQTREVFKAMVACERPFIWSLRSAQHEWLPKEAQASIRTQFDSTETPYLILNWAPQKLILAHRSVCVFVSHCGWNSTLESIHSGVPIVAWVSGSDRLTLQFWILRIGTITVFPFHSQCSRISTEMRIWLSNLVVD
ncbi:hypothetical protein RvY_14951 [Ramazzottius varieornatus]|uniref:Glucuronosyltransferase n=1 Tax=Ramazzottius varieornatus TaxID=947166 RepID=A0A1D1VUU5_RAMVA|nr:hypothetical protein RvY_14951 [Ramazzottius varieornatus]